MQLQLWIGFCGICAASASREAPGELFAVHPKYMSIEKESTGVPEVNVSKRTTKVNLGMILGVLVFFAITVGVVIWLSANE